MSNFLRVAHLNTCIGNPQGDMDNIDWEAVQAQLSIIQEEFEELVEAVRTKNLTELRDATSDVLVTTYGMAHRVGFDADKDMDEVHNSNMSKFCHTTDEAARTAQKYEMLGIDCMFRYLDDGAIAVISAANQTVSGKYYPKGKLLKSINFKEPVFT